MVLGPRTKWREKPTPKTKDSGVNGFCRTLKATSPFVAFQIDKGKTVLYTGSVFEYFRANSEPTVALPKAG